jgi:formylglycine-generating enzyme required for sulfatase activity/tRNA A-37 threonylcarbamoyl transferase component Bud32
MVWAPGAKILNNTYEIIEVIGMGGFGLTYRARQCLLDSEVVIKTPNPFLKNRPLFANFVKRFLDEAKQLDKLRPLNHPHIVSIRGMFEYEGTYGMVMDYVVGQNMIDAVRCDGPLREAEAIRCIKDVGGALMAMHGCNLVHRDVHPGNIMLRKYDGKPILIDFGLATEVADEVASYDHFAHKIFAAYEQSQGDGRVTVDVYALAGSMFYLVTGKNPTAAAMRILGNPLEFPKEVRLSDQIKVAIAAGMEMDVTKRTPSVAAWLALLEPPQNPLILDLGNGIKIELVRVPAGSFMMGSNDRDYEKPIHRVNVPEFLMAKYQVTYEQWQAVMGSLPQRFIELDDKFKGKNHPIVIISWNDAQEFCKKLSQKTGRKVKLPSEAQWEYACRAGSTGKYCFGDNEDQLGKYAWYDKNSDYKTHPVGEKLANAWGLHDMHGNVWEWCEDVWHDSYNGAPTDGSAWLSGGNQNQHILRGGSWDYFDQNCRSANRLSCGLGIRYLHVGFRFVSFSDSSPL